MNKTLLTSVAIASLAAACAAASGGPGRAATAGDVWGPVPAYRAAAERIIAEVMKGNDSWSKMEQLCDGVGHRLSGSPALEAAIAWAQEALRKDGHENVRAEPVQVQKWVRGAESLELVAPRAQPLVILGLGMSVGTPPEGLQAPVVVVDGEEALKALGDGAQGRIVLFNNPMPPWTLDKGPQYGPTVKYRIKGPKLASEAGAVAVLVRSVTAHSLRSPHTGTTSYRDVPDDKRIPAAAVTAEDAELLARLARSGGADSPPIVRLKMAAKHHGEVPSANVVAELRGTERPEEVVVIGGHIDSWDVGQGAHDDASGCVIAMEALTTLRRLNLRPKRTVRVVLWTNEENGLGGGKAYAAAHDGELAGHVAAIESDTGGFDPVGFGVDLPTDELEAAAAQKLEALLPLLSAIAPTDPALGPMGIIKGFGGADVSPLVPKGVPAIGLRVDMRRYFDYHHSHADTLDKVDPVSLSRDVAAVAVLAYVLADMPGRLAPAQAAAPK